MYTPLPMKRSSRYGNNYWEAYSPKIKRNVRLFSDLEYDHWILVETNPKVKSFCEQPLRIKQCLNGEWVESIFDMWVEWIDGIETFVEVKYSEEFNPKHQNYLRVNRQTEAQKVWCQSAGKQYQVQTEKDIRGNRIYLENMRYLLPFARQRIRPVETDQQQVLRILQEQTLSIQDIQDRLPTISVSRVRESIYRLIYDGILHAINIDCVPLGKQTEVKCNG